MAIRQRRYSKEEIARRGQDLYETGIRQQVEAGNDGKIVAISGSCCNSIVALLRLLSVHLIMAADIYKHSLSVLCEVEQYSFIVVYAETPKLLEFAR